MVTGCSLVEVFDSIEGLQVIELIFDSAVRKRLTFQAANVSVSV
jgi:hypothetical protein